MNGTDFGDKRDLQAPELPCGTRRLCAVLKDSMAIEAMVMKSIVRR